MDVKTYEKKEQEALDLLDQAVQKMKEIAFVNPTASSDEDALGILVSKFAKWDGQGIFNIAYQAFEDSNFHSFNNKFEELWDMSLSQPSYKFNVKIEEENNDAISKQ